MIVAIGIFHFLHSPLLIIFPFIINTFFFDVMYIIYFFVILFLYTFINGECPISYICKWMNDRNYIAGENINYYPEMEYILQNQKNIDYYFGIMTTIYILTLFYVISRICMFSFFLLFTFIILLLYFLFVRKFLSMDENYFTIFQEITKYILFINICFFITQLNNRNHDIACGIVLT